MCDIIPINPYATLGRWRKGNDWLESSIFEQDVVQVKTYLKADESEVIHKLAGHQWLEVWRKILQTGWTQVNHTALNMQYIKGKTVFK